MACETQCTGARLSSWVLRSNKLLTLLVKLGGERFMTRFLPSRQEISCLAVGRMACLMDKHAKRGGSSASTCWERTREHVHPWPRIGRVPWRAWSGNRDYVVGRMTDLERAREILAGYPLETAQHVIAEALASARREGEEAAQASFREAYVLAQKHQCEAGYLRGAEEMREMIAQELAVTSPYYARLVRALPLMEST